MVALVDGKRVKTGGRAKGTPNKKSAALKAAQEEAIQKFNALYPNGFDGDAHALLAAIYKNEALDMTLRVEAAKAAIRFERPALSTVDGQVKGEFSYTAIPISERDAIGVTTVAGELADER